MTQIQSCVGKFCGIRTPTACRVFFVREGQPIPLKTPGKTRTKKRSQGFEWGYGGDGHSELAIALLWHVTKSLETALRLRQKFVLRFVMGFGDEWELDAATVRDWVADQLSLQEHKGDLA